MLSNRFAFGALAVACMAAAAGGGYLATRQATLSTAAATPLVPEAAATAAGVLPPAPTVPDSEPESTARPGATDSSVQPVRAPRNTGANRRTRSEAARSAPAGQPIAQAPVAVSDPAPAPEAAAFPADPRAAVPEPSNPEPLPATAISPSAELASSSEPRFEELVVSADSVIGLRLERGLSSDRARVEQTIEARVVRDVRVGRRVAIPAGAQAIGSVMSVDRGGRFKERARLGIAFHTLVLADGTRVPISTETLYRYGDAPGDRSAKKIGGGAVAGAILGAIVGGAKGAAVGATAGAGGGTAMVMAGDRSEAEFPSGAEITARIQSPVVVTVER
ncbi:MAG: hypothetical protein AB7N65_13800 [Vicinamibacterales bacterium]